MRQYAAAGTTLKLMVYHRYSWKVFWIVLGYGKGQFWRTAELVARNSEAQTGCPVTYTYSRREARRLLESTRLSRDRSLRGPHLPVSHRRLRPVPLRQGLAVELVAATGMFRWLERHFGWHLVPDRGGPLMPTKVCVIGLGKLGAPLAACMAARGVTVIGVDADQRKVDAINHGNPPVPEPGSPNCWPSAAAG